MTSQREPSAVSVPDLRFSIRDVMVAIAIIAGVLAQPVFLQQVAVVPALALFTAWGLLSRGYRRTAGGCFWCLAIPYNVLVTTACAFPFYNLALISLYFIIPTMVGFGIAWAILATRPVASPRRSRWAAWVSVITLTMLPAVTVWTVWPFRLEFLMARSALARLADQVAAGQTIRSPRWAGMFRVVSSAVNPDTGTVALIIDPNPGGPSAFVRVGGSPSHRPNCHSPVRGDWLHVDLGEGWCYHEED
jgi:hypothetical protein